MTKLIVLLLAIAVTGCNNDRTAHIEQEIAKIKNAPAVEPDAIPEPYVSDFYIYTAQNLRSPFIAPSLAGALSQKGRTAVYPDLSRVKGKLEQVALENLLFKGTIGRDNRMLALIQDDTGKVHRVQPGMYLGPNYGRVLSIGKDKIAIMEIIPNGSEGYVERPRTMVLVAGAK